MWLAVSVWGIYHGGPDKISDQDVKAFGDFPGDGCCDGSHVKQAQ